MVYMVKSKEDISGDISCAVDRGEQLSLMEPMIISTGSRFREELNDKAIDLVASSAGLLKSLPEKIVPGLASLVRGMNCYYSNLIEGHDTHPIDIEKALNNDYSSNCRKRDLQLEAKAHIEVQKWIDSGGLAGSAVTKEGLVAIHRKFCELLPDDLLWAVDANKKMKVRVLPGVFRDRDVRVGRHIPVSPGAVNRFLSRFEKVYSQLGRTEMIVNAASAHHRLLWIHPFSDGNGRVARLFSHAVFLKALGSGGIWSIARGLARNDAQYKELLANCDQPRRNDLDGRGNLSEEALVDFTRFFLEICHDQVVFMESLLRPDHLRERVLMWAEECVRLGVLPKNSGKLLEILLYKGGEISRGEVAQILNVGPRHARRVVAVLLQEGALASDSLRAPLRLHFSARLAAKWLPGLFPEKNMGSGLEI